MLADRLLEILFNMSILRIFPRRGGMFGMFNS
jgi:hypothetical protein